MWLLLLVIGVFVFLQKEIKTNSNVYSNLFCFETRSLFLLWEMISNDNELELEFDECEWMN